MLFVLYLPCSRTAVELCLYAVAPAAQRYGRFLTVLDRHNTVTDLARDIRCTRHCSSFNVWEDCFKKVLGEAHALVVCLIEPRLAPIVWVFDDLGIFGPGILSKETELGFGFWVMALDSLEVGEVRAIHCEYVVKLVEVGCLHLEGKRSQRYTAEVAVSGSVEMSTPCEPYARSPLCLYSRASTSSGRRDPHQYGRQLELSATSFLGRRGVWALDLPVPQESILATRSL